MIIREIYMKQIRDYMNTPVIKVITGMRRSGKSALLELTRDELMRRCSERMELTLDDPKRAIPVLDAMGFTSYQVTDKEHIHIFERLSESASLNMELAKAGIPVKGISITSEELEAYFLNLTGGVSHA